MDRLRTHLNINICRSPHDDFCDWRKAIRERSAVNAAPMHYRGEAKYAVRGSIRTMLAGWAVCCWGDKAFAVRANGNHTYNRAEVTCRKCLTVLEKSDAYAARSGVSASAEPK